MRTPSSLCLAVTLLGSTWADKHHLFNGFTNGNSITTLEFDDETNSLTVVSNITISGSGSRWMALDIQQKNLYVAGDDALRSYSVGSDLSLTYVGNVTLSPDTSCYTPNYVTVSTVSPYAVFTNPWSTGCPSYGVSVDASGNLASVIGNVTYDSTAGIHGLAVSPDGAYVYSADDPGSRVWVHSYDNTTGTITELQTVDAANARHLTVHPNGKWVYVVLENDNAVGVLSRDSTTGLLTNINITWSMLPDGATNSSDYWSDEVAISHPSGDPLAPKYLVSGTRSRDTSLPGYLNVYALDSDTGAITERLINMQSTGSGGHIANAVSTAKFSEDYFGLTDSDGFAAIYKINENATAAEAVAQLDFDLEPGNLVWY